MNASGSPPSGFILQSGGVGGSGGSGGGGGSRRRGSIDETALLKSRREENFLRELRGSFGKFFR